MQPARNAHSEVPTPVRTAYLPLLGLAALGSIACSAGGGGERSSDDGTGGAGGTLFPSSSGSGGEDPLGVGAGSGAGGKDPSCDSILEVTHRDFDETHPDFEMSFLGDVVRLQLVEATLGADARPVFRDGIGCPQDEANPTACANWAPTQPVITSKTTFDQWFHSIDGVNIEFPRTLELVEQPPGSGDYLFDSTAFFPLGPDEGFGITPASNPQGQNFLFTTELHMNFVYEAGQVFTFRGDDDLWIFVNGRLALDLGSMHLAVQGTIDFDAQAATLGISPGETYAMDIFQAERHTSESNFRFETNISCFTPVEPPK
jgi:fibro-slime domain-containing protein